MCFEAALARQKACVRALKGRWRGGACVGGNRRWRTSTRLSRRVGQGCWRERLGGAGVKSCAISGSGVFRDAGTDERVREIFFDGQTPDFQIVIPDFGIVQGAFQVTGISYAGSHNGEATYDLSLASAGQLAFTTL